MCAALCGGLTVRRAPLEGPHDAEPKTLAGPMRLVCVLGSGTLFFYSKWCAGLGLARADSDGFVAGWSPGVNELDLAVFELAQSETIAQAGRRSPKLEKMLEVFILTKRSPDEEDLNLIEACNTAVYEHLTIMGFVLSW